MTDIEDFQGRWALITGASAGIGAEFARQLAASGTNLILVARRTDRLQTLAASLEDRHAIKAVTITADLSKPDAPDAIAEQLKRHALSPDILVNNAGFGMTGQFLEHDWPEHQDFLNLMVGHYVGLTRLMLPAMVDRGFGRIIHVSSVAGLVPGGRGHTLYGPTKAFLVPFAQSLQAEYKREGIRVTALCPGFTRTEFHDVNGTRPLVSKLPGFMMRDADEIVAAGLAAVSRGHVVYVPGRFYKTLVWLMNSLPRPWAAFLMRSQSKRVRKSD